MTTPIKGFMKLVEVLVKERPGLAAEEYAQAALDSGLAHSNSKDPIQSLATTLAKQVREGRSQHIYSEKARGKLRYYPMNDAWNPPGRRMPDLLFTDVEVCPDTAERIKTMVGLGLFKSELDAASWLVEEGVKANLDALDGIASRAKEVERQKEEARALLKQTA